MTDKFKWIHHSAIYCVHEHTFMCVICVSICICIILMLNLQKMFLFSRSSLFRSVNNFSKRLPSNKIEETEETWNGNRFSTPRNSRFFFFILLWIIYNSIVKISIFVSYLVYDNFHQFRECFFFRSFPLFYLFQTVSHSMRNDVKRCCDWIYKQKKK